MANPVETKTRSTGVWAWHTRSCSIARGGTRCSCGPAGYIARVRIDGALYGSGVRRTEAEAPTRPRV